MQVATGASPLTIADRIHRSFDSLTPSERKCARWLLANYPLAGLAPLAEYARDAGVSHPSVLRFIAKLDIGGYALFQSALRAELAARLKSPLTDKSVGVVTEGTGAVGGQHFLERFADANRENIRQTVASLPNGAFEGAVTLLADDTKSLHLLGGRFSDALASYLHMRLRILRGDVHHIVGMSVSWAECLLDIDANSVLVVFDVRRYQGDLEYFARAAAKRGARVLLVTDQWLSPIAGVADHILPAHVEVPTRWDSVVAVMMLVEGLLAALIGKKWSQLEGRISDLETLRGQYEGTWPSGG